MRFRAFCALLALSMACGCSLQEAKSVLNTVWDAARLLCLVANAEKAGTTVDDVADKCCKTREEIAPWFEAAKAGARAGAVKAGMSEPLSPANAEPHSELGSCRFPGAQHGFPCPKDSLTFQSAGLK